MIRKEGKRAYAIQQNDSLNKRDHPREQRRITDDDGEEDVLLLAKARDQS